MEPRKRQKLRKRQREALLRWISEGLQTDEINERAAEFDPPFEVSRQHVDHYRSTRAADIQAIQQAGEYDALTTGLALRGERVRKLQRLAALLEEDIFGDRLWVDQVKMVSSGEKAKEVNYEEFNAAEVKQYRGILDDIAKEMGHRKTVVEHGGEVAYKVYGQTDAFDPDSA